MMTSILNVLGGVLLGLLPVLVDAGILFISSHNTTIYSYPTNSYMKELCSKHTLFTCSSMYPGLLEGVFVKNSSDSTYEEDIKLLTRDDKRYVWGYVDYEESKSRLPPGSEYEIELMEQPVPMFLSSTVVRRRQRHIPSHIHELIPTNDATESYEFRYTGKNVQIYFMDGRIRGQNLEFRGFETGSTRVWPDMYLSTRLQSAGIEWCMFNRTTHLVSICTGLKYGLAKDAYIHEVAVYPACISPGHISSMYEGLVWVAGKHVKSQNPPSILLIVPTAISSYSTTGLNNLVTMLTHQGVIVVTSSGDTSDDACLFSPGEMENVITVGSLNGSKPAATSNYGRCVTIWAPGTNVAGVHLHDKGETEYSGSPVAASIVTGLIATYMEQFPESTIDDVKEWLFINSEMSDTVPYVRIAKLPSRNKIFFK